MFGFYDDAMPIDFLQNDERYRKFEEKILANNPSISDDVFKIRKSDRMSKIEYVGMLKDSICKLQKTVCLARHFHLFDMKNLGKKELQLRYIDIWPMNFFSPKQRPDNCAELIMQLACVLHMVPKWKSSTTIRLLVCSKQEDQDTAVELWRKQLAELRIDAEISVVVCDLNEQLGKYGQWRTDEANNARLVLNWNGSKQDYARSLNRMLVGQSEQTAVTFLYLPNVPDYPDEYESYLNNLDTLTEGLPPTLLIHGNDQVVSASI